jgi:transcriptional regulator GlxA family with amidase domain
MHCDDPDLGAAATGCNSAGYLAAVFRKRFSGTPRARREACRKG